MTKPEPSLHTTIRPTLQRMVVSFALYTAAAATATGAYAAIVTLMAWFAHEAWGPGGALATVAASLLMTALVAFAVAHRVARPPARSASPGTLLNGPTAERLASPDASHDPDPPGAGPGARLVAMLLGYRPTPEALITAGSLMAATVAIAGPVRLLRLAVRCFVVVRTVRSILGAAQGRQPNA